MADQTSPLNAVANPYQAYDAMLNQQIAQLSQPRTSDLDPMAMLAIAQGLLSPTRTGSFGESMGNAAGAAIGPLSRARQTDQDRMDKIAKLRETQVRLALEKKRIEDLNTRAAAGYGYGRDPSLIFQTDMNALENARKGIDLVGYDIDPTTDEGKAELAERRREYKLYSDQIKKLTAQRFGFPQGGQGAGTPTPGGAPAASPPPPPAASVNAAKKGQAGLVPTEEELKNARVVDGVKYIKRGNQVYRVDE